MAGKGCLVCQPQFPGRNSASWRAEESALVGPERARPRLRLVFIANELASNALLGRAMVGSTRSPGARGLREGGDGHSRRRSATCPKRKEAALSPLRGARTASCRLRGIWLRGQDLNLRPSGYEPDELPGCSTPRGLWGGGRMLGSGRPREASRGGSRAFVQAWRRPALPPLGGQYPGRGAVSRPSSEWGRVVPARCGHQAGTKARGQTTEDRGQTRRRRSESHPGLVLGVVKLGHGSRGRRFEDRAQQATTPGSGAVVLCPLISGAQLRARDARLGLGADELGFERLGPVSCTRCRAFTPGLSTWWSTTALNETWSGGGFPA
ncbi:MAG: hypothetical protein K0R41_926 [Geminicoccaceae bacterium]|nr:hypothetical protein [Geminicoccaceae bacterium]